MRRLGLDDLDLAALLLGDGGVVAIPTDTVYGLAARFDVPKALDALYEAKGRPETKPLPVLVADLSGLEDLLGEVPAEVAVLAERHWPGALTIVAPCGDDLARRVRSSAGTVGIRCPDDPTARALLRLTGPLCVSSANRSGEEPCRSADEVMAALASADVVMAVLDAGARRGDPSTVVIVEDGEMRIVRQGSLEL